MTNTFFDAHGRATIEAAMARIIPSDDGLPGAGEAGCIDFVERYLSGLDYIFAKPDGSGFEILQGRSADAWRQRIEIMRGKYADGIRELDARALARFDAAFKDLSPADQDEILHALEAGAAHAPTTLTVSDGLAGPLGEPALQQTSTETDLDFFPLLVAHTRQGFYADPIYGGNRDRSAGR